MPENLKEESEVERPDYRRYLDILRRRRVLFFVLVLIGWLLVWGASWSLPARYKSSTLILVQQPEIAKNYIAPGVGGNLQERLQSITQQILSRTRLLMIIGRFHLYSGAKPNLTPDEKVDQMRKDIEVELVRDSRSGSIRAFRVSYMGPTSQIAQGVTGELTKLFISENVNANERQSLQTAQFIRDQLTSAQAKLAKEDAQVRAFQAAHAGELPSQQGSNLQILSGLQAQLQNEEDALNTANQQRVYEQTLIEQYRNMPADASEAGSASPALVAINQQLIKLESNLAALNSRYTARYPGVEELKQEIAKTKQARKDLLAQRNAGGNPKPDKGGSGDDNSVASWDNASMLQLSSQLRANESEIRNRRAAIANVKSKIDAYQARLNAQPAVEQELTNLTRSYQQAQANYDDLLKKENEAQMAARMEQIQGGQQFSVLDPPSLPLRPYSPMRLKLWAVGVVAGLALGLLVVAFVEKMDDRLYSDREIEKLLSVGVIAEIPEIENAEDERRKRKSAIFGWVFTGLVCATILTGAVISYLHT